MTMQNLPSVNSQYRNQFGDTFVVIGRGTRGIIVEYHGGRVELISPKKWQTMNRSVESQQKH